MDAMPLLDVALLKLAWARLEMLSIIKTVGSLFLIMDISGSIEKQRCCDTGYAPIIVPYTGYYRQRPVQRCDWLCA